MNYESTNNNQTVFEQIKNTAENGNEFWGGRKLSKILEYSEYRHFLPVIERVNLQQKLGQKVKRHF